MLNEPFQKDHCILKLETNEVEAARSRHLAVFQNAHVPLRGYGLNSKNNSSCFRDKCHNLQSESLSTPESTVY